MTGLLFCELTLSRAKAASQKHLLVAALHLSAAGSGLAFEETDLSLLGLCFVSWFLLPFLVLGKV